VIGNASDGRVTRLMICRAIIAMISVRRLWQDADVSQAMHARYVEPLGCVGRDAGSGAKERYGCRLKNVLLLG
jgi:hypothetical protein